MNIQRYETLFFVVTFIVVLLVASPALRYFAVLPPEEYYTEFAILGAGRRAENYPFNITENEDNSVFLNIENHLGYCAYYLVEVKFRNLTQASPDVLNRTSSNLRSLYNITAFVSNNGTWELPVTFSFNYEYDINHSRLNFNTLTFNDAKIDLKGHSATWFSQGNLFFGELIFELWIYDNTIHDFQYHERFTYLRLNMTVPSYSSVVPISNATTSTST